MLFAILAFSIRTIGGKLKEVFKWNLYLGTLLLLASFISNYYCVQWSENELELMNGKADVLISVLFLGLSLLYIFRNSRMSPKEVVVSVLLVSSGTIVYFFNCIFKVCI
ncbi:hypothetical protein KEM09_14650 [Carboxylicivirga mesophila]|uniref:EamA domain-containing protein n=1 Tax=Carboxylicivirga mesophila TaxID=1166478 RepID=A0ABS5KC93_9BACT|nr:hypothetical protein [Carboxylicivirga mesophila]MBS2212655.1 hypothetical protein [Carboxylicivirga mesophila]